MEVKILESAGLVYFYICGVIEDNEVNMITVDSYRCLPNTFYDRVKEIFLDTDEDIYHIFGVIGESEKVDYIESKICDGLKSNVQNVIDRKNIEREVHEFDEYGNSFFKLVQEFFCDFPPHLPIKFGFELENMKAFTVYSCNEENADSIKDIQAILKCWISNEEPKMFGRQVMIRSFFLRDLVGRKIVDYIPNQTTTSWNLLMEGGVRVPLGNNDSYTKECANFNELGYFSISGVNNTLMNPIYGLGLFLLPQEICAEWHKVFLFACSLSKQKWTKTLLVEKYYQFLEFLLVNVCIDSREIDIAVDDKTIITKDQYFEALLRQIETMREFLEGEDEIVISKDLLQTMNSRYVYLPYIYNIVNLQNLANREFNTCEFISMIEKAIAEKDNFKKGVLWEGVADYFIECISGLEISAKRIKAGFQEIDCSVVNVSLDDRLWQLGSYILVECKNWNRKVGVAQIRNTAYISSMKGNKTAIFFTLNGITKKAKEEIERLVQTGLYIVCIDNKDLKNVNNNEDCSQLMLTKWEELNNIKEKYPRV